MNYSPATALEAEGARVGFITCLDCGAAILLDPRDERTADAIHDQWHGRLASIPEERTPS